MTLTPVAERLAVELFLRLRSVALPLRHRGGLCVKGNFFPTIAVDETIMTQYRNLLENVSLNEKGISRNFHVQRMDS